MKIFQINFLKTSTALILALSMVLVFIIPKQAGAIPVVVTDGHVLTTRINILPSDPDLIMKVTKFAVRILVRQLLQETTNMIVRWIQGNNGSNVGYVKNPQQFFRNVANRAGGEFLNQLTGINLCGNIGAFLQISLRTPPGLQQKLACSLTDIVQNVNSFYRNFNNGGWRAFISASVEPQNNPYGAYLIALQAKVDAESSAMDSGLLKLQASYPFLGFEAAVPTNCRTRVKGSESPNTSISGTVPLGEGEEPESLSLPAANLSSETEEVCDTEYKTLTPGQLIQSQLAKAAGSGIDWAVNSDDIDGALTTIVQALINRIINSATGIFAGSDPDQDPGNIPISGLENANWFISRIQNNIFYADALISSINGQLQNSYRELFALRRNPQPLQTEESISANPIQTLEDKIFNLHRSKKEIITVKDELLTVKRTTSSTTDVKQLTDINLSMPGLTSRLNSIASSVEITATPATASGSQKWDTVQEIQGSVDAISSSLALIGTMAEEASRIASSTVTADRRAELERLSAELLNNKSKPLQDLRTNLSLLKDHLTRALTTENIQAFSAEALSTLEEVNTPLKNADEAVEKANIVLKQQ